MKLTSHRAAINGAITAYLRAEASAGFHVVTVYGTPEEFAAVMEDIRRQIENYFANLVGNFEEKPNAQQFKILFFTCQTKPK